MNFFLDNGYLDFRKIRELGFPFTWVVGGRGIGKTYGALRTSYEDSISFLLMQRTQTQLDVINSPAFSPMNAIGRDVGVDFITKPVTKNSSAFYLGHTDDKGKLVPEGYPLGYSMALSTFANTRGFDASEIELLYFDEFVPEKCSRPIRNEAETLVSAYESINRNRELQGRKPLQMIATANALDLSNCHLVYHRLVRPLEKMEKTGNVMYVERERGVCIIYLRDSPISARKKTTALYKALEGNSAYSKMALDNNFSFEDRSDIRSRPLSEYKPLVTVGEVTVYQHKSTDLYYVSPHRAGSPPRYATGETDLERFRRGYGFLWLAILEHRIEFEDFLSKTLLTTYL